MKSHLILMYLRKQSVQHLRLYLVFQLPLQLWSHPAPSVCTSSVNVTTTIMSPFSSVSSFSPVNLLVCACLVPEDLSDILVTPSSDAAVAKKRTKRIVGARHLTSNEYVEMLKSEERKKKEAEDLKEQKKVERERQD